jgi:hypothetical protein
MRMSDEAISNPDLFDSPVRLWCPNSALRGRLLLGALAALAFGGLAAAESLAKRGQDQGQVITTARIFGAASLVPLAGILWAYVGLARETDSFGLRKSSYCALGVILLGKLHNFTRINLLKGGWDTMILGAVTAGLIGLLIVAFYSPSKADSAGKDARPKTSKAGWGGLGIALVLFIEFAFRILVRIGINGVGWEWLVWLLLIVCTVGFWLWFAVCKIRLSDKLGSFAAFVGVAEILGIIVVGAFFAYMLIAMAEATQQPGVGEKAHEELAQYWTNLSAWVVAGATLAWASVTALLFLTLWNRHDAEADWLRDLRNAENAY